MEIDINAALLNHDMDDIILIVGESRYQLTVWLAAVYRAVGYPTARLYAENGLELLNSPEPVSPRYFAKRQRHADTPNTAG